MTQFFEYFPELAVNLFYLLCVLTSSPGTLTTTNEVTIVKQSEKNLFCAYVEKQPPQSFSSSHSPLPLETRYYAAETAGTASDYSPSPTPGGTA